MQKLVIVDFWATWCNPCKQLMPVLVKLADEYQGQFILAKVDIDQNKQLAGHFNVRSVPAVKFIHQGQMVDEFTGILSADEIRRKLGDHIERESDRLYAQALNTLQDALQHGDKTVFEKIQHICLQDTANSKISIHFATLLVQTQQYEQVKAFIKNLPDEIQQIDEIKNLLAQLEIFESSKDLPDISKLVKNIQNNPGDLVSRHQYSKHLILQGQSAEAMEQLLEIVQHDREFEDDLGRKELLKLFDIINGQGEAGAKLVSQYRKKLARCLN